MRKPLLVYASLILVVSCTRYQYASIGSSNMTMNDKSEFVAENDTIRLQYNFNGQNAPVNLVIENKLDVPVYIDWRQSALIVNDKAISYMPSETSIIGNVNAVHWADRYPVSFSLGTLGATATSPAPTDFIPPHSYITKKPMSVINYLIKDLPDTSVRKVRVPTSDGGAYMVKRAAFSETSSPVRFRSYLTLMVGEAGGKPMVYEHRFYITELLTTFVKPDEFGYTLQNRGNQYYIKEATGFGKTATGFGVFAGTAVITGAAAAINPNSGCNNCSY